MLPTPWEPHSWVRLTKLVCRAKFSLGDLPICPNGGQIPFLGCQIWQILHVGFSDGNVSADKTSVVSADKTSVVSADKTSVVSLCQQTSPKTSPPTFPPQGRPRSGRPCLETAWGMSWETTDVLSADTTDVLTAAAKDFMSADTTGYQQSGGNLAP